MYQVYYMNNDGRKVVVAKNLSYEKAVKVWQQLNTDQPHLFLTNYERM